MMMGRNVNTNIKMFKKMLKIESLVQVGVFSYLSPLASCWQVVLAANWLLLQAVR